MPVIDFDLAVQHHGGRAVIQIGGEVDLATGPQLKAVLVKLVDRGFYQLIVDLEQVSFLIVPGSACWSMRCGASKRTAAP